MFTRLADLPRRWLWTLLVAAIVLGLAGWLALVFVFTERATAQVDRVAQARTYYESVARNHRTRAYPRPPSTPGWALEPGPAAPHYRAALSGCELLDERDAHALYRAMRWLEAPDTAGAAPSLRVASPACLEHVDAARADHPVVVELSEGVCEALSLCDEALDAVLEGSRRAEMRSVFAVWDESTRLATTQRLPERAYQLARLAALRAWLRDPGTQGERLDALAAMLRFAADLGHGGSLLGMFTGIAVESRARDELGVLVRSDTLAEPQLAHLLAELVYLEAIRPSFVDTLVGEFVTLTPAMLEMANVLVEAPPTAVAADPSVDTAQEFSAAGEIVAELPAMWDALFAAQSLPLTRRLEAYRRLVPQPGTGRAAPLIAGIVSAMRSHTIEAAVEHSATRLLTLDVAARLYRVRHGRMPSSVEALVGLVPLELTRDPLSGDPFLVVGLGDGLVIAASSTGRALPDLDDAQRERLTTQREDHAPPPR